MSILRLPLFYKCYINAVQTRTLPLNSNLRGRTLEKNVRRNFTTTPKISKQSRSSQIPSFVIIGLGSLGTFTALLLKSHRNSVLAKAKPIITNVQNQNSKEIFRWKIFFKYLYPHIWYLLLALSSALVVALLNIWIPQSVGDVINALTRVAKSGNSNTTDDVLQQLKEPAIKLIHMYVTQALFTFGYIFMLSHIGERMAAQMRHELFRSIIMQDIAFFDKNRTGEIVNRLTTDIQEFKSTFKTCISQGLRSIIQIAGCVVSVIVISPQLTTAMVITMPSIIIIGTIIGKGLRKLSTEAQNQFAKATAVCEEAIQNIKTVRAFAAEDKETENFYKETELGSKLYERLGFGIGLFQAGTNLFLNGILLSTLYFGGYLMSTGQLSPGDLMAFLMATQTIQRSLSQLSLLFGSYIRGASAGARVFEFLDMPPSPMMIGGKMIENESLVGNINFKNVTFSYPTRPNQVILKKFNLVIPAGKTVAIVGASGNGKSTVAALLERFYDVDEGSISIDGMDIRTLNSSYLRRNVLGYIDQEPILFATSIMENIRYGKPDATDEEIIGAAKEANAHEFISMFSDGYETKVGERGAQLSGGQKQRIAIARALIKKPSILILDEATSALDYESERIVQKALDNAIQGRTVVVIAHRLSTIKGADIIVVLQRGVIAEMGSHSSLLKKKGIYYTLINEQERENA
ncbi:mitochondrial potassium channel ATP-binding subunit [Prorops nasuta]|uniref:mitochondrial potassium channel ATP-binding subunit n=1 Tax=Prorops nasuta TaxID=863751 RepID=UPI0034CF8B81